MKPLCIDLFCGLGGWSEAFLSEGYRCVGFDIERHDYGSGGYPAHLVLQDILTVHGSQFRDAAVIVASPPCQKYSYMAMPWTRAKALAAWYRESQVRIDDLNALFHACFRIQLEASKAAGRYIPLVVENVKGAQPWVGRAKWHYGSFYLWGDVPALMPHTLGGVMKRGVAHRSNGETNFHGSANRAATKVPGLNWSGYGQPGYVAKGFNVTATQRERGTKNTGGSWFAISSPGQQVTGNNPDGRKVRSLDGGLRTDIGKGARFTTRDCGIEGTKFAISGHAWFRESHGALSSKSSARKAASAAIAKIPFPLAQHIARTYKP